MDGRYSLFLYTMTHFWVDFFCFLLLFGGPAASAAPQTMAVAFLLYNGLAFGLQPVCGFLADRFPRLPPAALGLALILVGWSLRAALWPGLILCAVGNAGFHVGGGRDSLVLAGGKLARSGIFVSTGALGVSLGILAGRAGFLIQGVTGTTLLAVLFVLLWRLEWRKPISHGPPYLVKGEKGPPRHAAFPGLLQAGLVPGVLIALCLLSVTVRAYVGGSVPMPWRVTPVLIALAGAAAFLGKLLGGLLADRFGPRLVGIGSLALSAPLLCLGYGHAVPCLIGLLLFNMSMPVTLCGAAAVLPKAPAFAFGLTALFLLVGTLPTYFWLLPPQRLWLVGGALIALSALCIRLAFARQKRRRHSDEKAIHPAL